MPIIVIGQEPTVRVDHHDLRQLRQHWINWMNVKLAEVPCKSGLLLGGQWLPAKEQNLMFDQQLAQAIDARLRQFAAEVDIINDGAKCRGYAGNSEVHAAARARSNLSEV
jgi:hypothetical protein